VKIWASIVTRILSYKGTNQNSPVSLVLHRKKLISITSDMINNLLRDGVVGIGETKLGIKWWEVGTHSIQSDAAMAMYLAGSQFSPSCLLDDGPAQLSSATFGNKCKNSHTESRRR
jgi:hypothetical protein